MVINISAKQKSDIGTVFKEYLRGRYSGGLKIKRIQGKKARDDAFLAAYKRFSGCKAEAYKVATIYGIKVCPYCNINYTYVVKRGKKCVCRPDFDHFVAKTDCPKKALDIMNLIPCCQQCNSRVKHKKHFSRRSHIHPYYDDFDSCYRFDYRLRKKGLLSESNLEILLNVLDSSGRTGKFIADMELWPRYQNHKDVVFSIMKRAQRYPINSKGFTKHYSKLVSKKNLIDLIYPELSCDIMNVSLGKLKKDIAMRVLTVMQSGGKI